jgi:hypothetical protein
MLWAVGLAALLACASSVVPLLWVGRMRIALQLMETVS